MNRRSLLAALLVAPLTPAAVASCKRDSSPTPTSASEGGAKAARLRIAVIPKGTTHEFWKAVHAGANKGGLEADVEVLWKGPLKEDDLKAQIDVVQSFIAQGVSGVVLAPLSDTALRSPVKAAVAAGIPVVVFDSDLRGDEHASFVATDNVAAGRLAADALAKSLGGKGRVLMLRYQVGSASTQGREEGFLAAIKEHPGVQVVSDNQYGGATTESAFSTSERLLSAQRAGADGVQGVFTPNESTTFGMLLALRKGGLAGKVKLVGFDASDKLLEALEGGHVEALVVQDPFKIGYLAVKTMAAKLRGQPVDKRIDTGARLVTKASLAEPAVRELVHPDLKKWLNE
ncbi:MAG TPA: substrate-binding domain-containing protein [Polyangiaceae bacterium]|nr:substrate-binding domain-containing protein [Polyangiaceae bacterium]